MKMDIRIRTTTDHDRDVVTGILQASYPVLLKSAYESSLLDRVLPLMTRANDKLITSGTYYLVLFRDIPVACGGWTALRPWHNEETPDIAHLRHIAVHPGYIGNGVGRALIDRCFWDALRNGINRFECYSTLNAEGFYASLGFRSLQKVQVPMGENCLFPAMHMELNASPA